MFDLDCTDLNHQRALNTVFKKTKIKKGKEIGKIRNNKTQEEVGQALQIT